MGTVIFREVNNRDITIEIVEVDHVGYVCTLEGIDRLIVVPYRQNVGSPFGNGVVGEQLDKSKLRGIGVLKLIKQDI